MDPESAAPQPTPSTTSSSSSSSEGRKRPRKASSSSSNHTDSSVSTSSNSNAAEENFLWLFSGFREEHMCFFSLVVFAPKSDAVRLLKEKISSMHLGSFSDKDIISMSMQINPDDLAKNVVTGTQIDIDLASLHLGLIGALPKK